MARTGMPNKQSITITSTRQITIGPWITDYDVPAEYFAGEKFNVRIAFSERVTGLHQNNVQDVFILEGDDLFGTPTPYKWTGTSAPDFTAEVPDDLTGTDWQLLAAPNPPIPNSRPPTWDPQMEKEFPRDWLFENNYDGDDPRRQWHGEELQYLLVQWVVQEGAEGIFSMSLRERRLKGEFPARDYFGHY